MSTGTCPSSYPPRCAEATEFRSDVQIALTALTGKSRRRRAGFDQWHWYDSAKQRLSRLCGHDAPDHLFDQNEYDRAVRFLVVEGGI